MKTFFLLLLFVPTMTGFSQNHYRGIGRGGPSLVAEKRGHQQHYRMGAAVRIVKNDESKTVVSGFITQFHENSLTIEPFKMDSAGARIIQANEIGKIKFLSRRGRKAALIMLGAGAVYAGVMALITDPGPFRFIVFIPAMAAGIFFIYYFPLTYIADNIFQKSRSKGWRFRVELNYSNRE